MINTSGHGKCFTTGNKLFIKDLKTLMVLFVTILDDTDSDTYVIENEGSTLFSRPIGMPQTENRKVDAHDPRPEIGLI